MFDKRHALVAGLLVLGAPALAQAPSYRVVVHKDHPAASIERKELANIFLGMKTKWDLINPAHAGL